jgi:putative phosphoserine phosphatase/1-acylglycerol-3-phosphate O-acyltransferase
MDAQLQPPQDSPSVPPLASSPEVVALLQENPVLQGVARKLLERADRYRQSMLEMLARCRRLQPDFDARPEAPTQVAAFFDLDGTVLAGSIVQHLTRQGFAEGQGSVHHLLQFVACFLLYKVNLIPRVTMYKWGYAPAVGMDLHVVQDFVDRCLEQSIKHHVFEEAHHAVAAHRAAGHRIVAITGAPDYAAAEVATHLGMHDLLATPTPLAADATITDAVQEPICYSEGKLAYLHAYARLHNIDLSRSYFYSDSASDLPVLKAVGKPRVINSQWLLLPYAIYKGWPRRVWKRKARAGLPVASSSRALTPQPGTNAAI